MSDSGCRPDDGGPRCYAGIGSRRTPDTILEICAEIARALAERGWRLRSGHSPGADQAFESGADREADVFLPWLGFESAVPVLGRAFAEPSPAAFDLARRHHPGWAGLGRDERALLARDSHQVLGWTLDEPARFAVCWTPDGSLDGRGPLSGGTDQTLRVCVAYAVPVFNLRRDDHLARLAGLS